MRFVIVTGMSGAGKSSVLKMLEDAGYFCVDNLPIPLVGKFAELASTDLASEMQKIALGIDIRSGEGLAKIKEVLSSLHTLGIDYEILYLECSDTVLVKRFKETRRTHPLSGDGRIESGIAKERKKMKPVKELATYIIDTSQLLTRELKAEVSRIFVENQGFKNFYVTIVSFGFKYGIPTDADLVFDVRFLPNPFYVDSLKPKTGNDQDVYDYVMKAEEAHIFLDKLEDMVSFLIPNYITEGKNQLVIGIGCTGGKHRSVTLANAFYKIMKDKDYGFKVEHRDIQKR